MTTTPLRLGLLGCADFARAKMLPGLAHVPEVRLTACAARERAKAEVYAAQFGGEAVEGYAALLGREDVDAVYVPLPNSLHHPWALQALKAGKHVLLEKPLTPTGAEAAELVAAARTHGVQLMENFLFLQHTQTRAVLDLIAAGGIGTPRMLHSSFGVPPREREDIRLDPALAGGALLDLGTYPVRAAGLLLGHPLRPLGATLHIDPATGVDTRGGALLTGPQGELAQLSFAFGVSYRSYYELWGTEGRIVVERAFTAPPDHRPRVTVERGGRSEELGLAAYDQYAATWREFARRIRTGEQPAAYESELLAHAALLEEIGRVAERH